MEMLTLHSQQNTFVLQRSRKEIRYALYFFITEPCNGRFFSWVPYGKEEKRP